MKITLISSVFLLLPVVGMATERAITVSSLDSAYKTQVAVLDSQIADAQKDSSSAKIPVNCRQECETAQQEKDRESITSALRDKQQLEVTYSLLQAALQ